MLVTLLGAVVIGLLIGVAAALALPVKRRLRALAPLTLGALGSVPATWLTYQLSSPDVDSGFKVVPLAIGVWTAGIAVAVYAAASLQSGSE
ncbi:hypothetical protein BVC93_04470 [Mycobacterium sp. MS1601]|uniref:hypothetical protein n=1 Tax=Mycobacterium sp. MS1601 TaxID=1936029 RepID=UPI0009796990|nr:hypothetical protein [Mycobacterium sp. MS1601]AQA01816.1 hypothetical protein BVC93_04470 [Mycobacterium sp. MS1601]